MPLARILPPEHPVAPKWRDVMIHDLTCDSREVKKGALFAAFKGVRTDGLSHLEEAQKKGAAAFLLPEGAPHQRFEKMPAIFDKNPRQLFAQIAARFFKEQPRITVAVTGTNGKSSTALFAEHLFRASDPFAASLGTLGMRQKHHAFPLALTTPSPEKIQSMLALLARRGARHAVLEASSHGLAQHRLDGLRLSAAAFTHIGRDHLDYHKSQKSYLQAKMRILELLPEGKPIVLYDRAKGARAFAEAARKKGIPIFWLSHKKGDLLIKKMTRFSESARANLSFRGKDYDVLLPLIGGFQIMNALLAAALALAADPECEKNPQKIFDALQTLPAIPGRVEYMGESAEGGHVYVDYAHTPDALEALLSAMRPHCRGRLHLLFGCGGERDQKKRGEMGALAQKLADEIIITDDNPRGEDPSTIRRMILSACPKARELAPREDAIAAAIAQLKAGDLLIIAGKGHEETQEMAGRFERFSDREKARLALIQSGGAALGGIA